MVKKVTKSNKKASVAKKNVSDLADEIIFTPTSRQSQVKAKFWARYEPGPFSAPDALTAPYIMQVTGTASIKEWWGKPGFKEWFLNREEAREKLEYLFMKALTTAEQLMDDPEAQANAKVQMIKVIAELANKFPSKNLERYADDDINKMDERQLLAYLESKGISIKQEKILELGSSDGNAESDNKEQS